MLKNCQAHIHATMLLQLQPVAGFALAGACWRIIHCSSLQRMRGHLELIHLQEVPGASAALCRADMQVGYDAEACLVAVGLQPPTQAWWATLCLKSPTSTSPPPSGTTWHGQPSGSIRLQATPRTSRYVSPGMLCRPPAFGGLGVTLSCYQGAF